MANTLFLDACHRQPVDRTPVWFMRQAGRYLPEYRAVRTRYSFWEMVTAPEIAAQVTMQPVDILGVDAAIIFSDILVIPRAMGMDIQLVENVGPVFDSPLTSEEQVNALPQDCSDDLSYVYEAVAKTREDLADKVPLIGFCGSPWTMATYMIEGNSSKDFTAIKAFKKHSPQALHRLLEKLAASATAYLRKQIEAGAQALQIFDSWGGMLPPQEYAEFSLRYITEIVDGLKDTKVPLIVFGLDLSHSLEKIAACGVHVVGIDWRISLGEAREKIGGVVALQGNLHPKVLYESPDVIRAKVGELLADYGDHPGHIFNLGHGLAPDMDVAHVKTAVDAVKEFSQTKQYI